MLNHDWLMVGNGFSWFMVHTGKESTIIQHYDSSNHPLWFNSQQLIAHCSSNHPTHFFCSLLKGVGAAELTPAKVQLAAEQGE